MARCIISDVINKLLEQELPSPDQLDLGEPESDEELQKRWKNDRYGIAYGGRGNLTAEELLRVLHLHDQRVDDFYNDPMTHAMGAPTDDFQRSFDSQEKLILSTILKLELTSAQKEFVLIRMARFFP